MGLNIYNLLSGVEFRFRKGDILLRDGSLADSNWYMRKKIKPLAYGYAITDSIVVPFIVSKNNYFNWAEANNYCSYLKIGRFRGSIPSISDIHSISSSMRKRGGADKMMRISRDAELGFLKSHHLLVASLFHENYDDLISSESAEFLWVDNEDPSSDSVSISSSRYPHQISDTDPNSLSFLLPIIKV